MKYYNYPNGTKTAEALDSENTSVVKGPDGKYIAPNELPAIKAEDAGKVVKVNAAGTGLEYGEAGGGGGNVLHVVFGFDGENPSCDHSFSEVFNALERKDLVIFSTAIIKGYGTGGYAVSCEYGDDYITVRFNNVAIDQSNCNIVETQLVILSDNTIEINTNTLIVSGTPTE